MTHSTATKTAEKGPWRSVVIFPKRKLTTVKVANVEQAIMVELKTIVSGLM